MPSPHPYPLPGRKRGSEGSQGSEAAALSLSGGIGVLQSGSMAYPPLLFVHGASTAAWLWEPWRNALKPLGWETIVLDLRGHGRSLPVDFTAVTLDDYAGDVESVATQIAAARGAHPVLVGWGMGGLVSLIHASRHPETPGLVLLAPAPPLEVAGRGDPDEIRKVPAAAVGPEHFGVYADDFERSRASLFDLTEDEVRLVMTESADALESGFAWRQAVRGFSIAPGSVQAPSLVVYGEEDAGRPPELMRRLAIYLAGEGLAVPGAGHWGIVYNEATVQRTATAVDGWLRRSVLERQG